MQRQFHISNIDTFRAYCESQTGGAGHLRSFNFQEPEGGYFNVSLEFKSEVDAYLFGYSWALLVMESKKPKGEQITVEVQGGVAYCDDPRVNIIDYDNREEEEPEA